MAAALDTHQPSNRQRHATRAAPDARGRAVGIRVTLADWADANAIAAQWQVQPSTVIYAAFALFLRAARRSMPEAQPIGIGAAADCLRRAGWRVEPPF